MNNKLDSFAVTLGVLLYSCIRILYCILIVISDAVNKFTYINVSILDWFEFASKFKTCNSPEPFQECLHFYYSGAKLIYQYLIFLT